MHPRHKETPVPKAPENSMDALKSKEEEMEAAVSEARATAESMAEDALKKAAEIREEGARSLDLRLKEVTDAFMAALKSETDAIGESAEKDAKARKAAYLERKDEALAEVVRFIASIDGMGGRGAKT